MSRARLRLLDLFSGIGGFSLGLERSGLCRTVAFCEIEPYPRRVLAKHWPEVPCYDDVRTLTAARLAADGITVDAICGGFPCQGISASGAGGGLDDERSGLWSEYARLVSEIRPQVVIVENSPNLLSGNGGQWAGKVFADLAAFGYDAEWRVKPASDVGAPHVRERLWIVAHPVGERQSRPWEYFDAVDPAPVAYREADGLVDAFRQSALPYVCGRHDGLSSGMDRLHALGNAVVPQIPELIGRAILAGMEQAA